MLQTATHKIHSNSTDMHYSFRAAVLKVLAYFDVFQYPVTIEEIKKFSLVSICDEELNHTLSLLINSEEIYLINGFYSLHDNPLLILRRKQNNNNAIVLLQRGDKIGRFLYQFPFVRAVAISGSLSKDVADEKADIDFFIITKSNRLWIARTIMHLYKKLTYLNGKQRLYCMNYFIDEATLQIKEQNIFTAVEIKTLKPVCGEKTTHLFFETNRWANGFLPACDFRSQHETDPHTSIVKRIFEWLFSNPVFDKLDNYLYHLTTKRWRRKEKAGKKNEKGVVMNLLTGKHFARTNPGSFQQKVLKMYDQKLKQLNID